MRISNTDKSYLDRAIKVASTSTERQKHGCVSVKGGRVLSVGVNTFRNHPLVVSDPHSESSYHAEVNALRSVDVVGATAYVARVTSTGPAKSEPCVACYKALTKAGIKRVIWTENNNEVAGIMT